MRIASLVSLVSAGAMAASLAACSHKSSSTKLDADEARDLLIDRNWLDRMPETDRDHLFVYRFVPTMGGGVFQDRTLYKGTFELFTFKTDADNIHFKLPETKTEVTSAYTIEKVDGPKPFDLKLTIADDPRGPHVYYGWSSETDVDGHVLEQRLHDVH